MGPRNQRGTRMVGQGGYGSMTGSSRRSRQRAGVGGGDIGAEMKGEQAAAAGLIQPVRGKPLKLPGKRQPARARRSPERLQTGEVNPGACRGASSAPGGARAAALRERKPRNADPLRPPRLSTNPGRRGIARSVAYRPTQSTRAGERAPGDTRTGCRPNVLGEQFSSTSRIIQTLSPRAFGGPHLSGDDADAAAGAGAHRADRPRAQLPPAGAGREGARGSTD